MARSYARLLDPTLDPAADPWAGYEASGEPLEDRLYLPCGVDPTAIFAGWFLPTPTRSARRS